MTPDNELIYLGSCLLRPELIDAGAAAGVTTSTWNISEHAILWRGLIDLHTQGEHIDETALYQHLGKDCPAQALFAASNAAPTSMHGQKALAAVIEQKRLRDLEGIILGIQEQIRDGGTLDGVKPLLDDIPALLEPVVQEEETLEDVAKAVCADFVSKAEGATRESDHIRTGLPGWDKEATPIERHELVIIGARPSVGKSSMGLKIANQAVDDGKKVAVFSLETSRHAVLGQMAAQRAKVNRKKPWDEFKDKQDQFCRETKRLANCGLLKIYDKDMSLEQIFARSRLLANSWKPDVVILDYLNIIRSNFGQSQYQKITHISSEMIALRKVLDCPLIVLAQFNRTPASENRAPGLADFRDSGKVEEDGHRIWAIHRPDKDDSGVEQKGQPDQLMELHQLKLRDGPCVYGRCRFRAPWTLFYQ